MDFDKVRLISLRIERGFHHTFVSEDLVNIFESEALCLREEQILLPCCQLAGP